MNIQDTQALCGGLLLLALLLALLWVFHPAGRKAGVRDYQRLRKEIMVERDTKQEELAARQRILPPGSDSLDL